jgi:catechol 2,3-dioxygenase-like lactoylglutathione lyase family enzyme
MTTRAGRDIPSAGASGEHAPAAILETALYVDDLEAARAFYGGVIGLALVTQAPGRHVFFRCGQGMLLLFDPEASARPSHSGPPVPKHGARGAGHMCFASADLDAWVSRFAAAGIPIEADFRWPNGARSIYLRDPAGNSVEFAEPRLWE